MSRSGSRGRPRSPARAGRHDTIMRAVDLVAGVCLLTILLPVLGAIALAIRMTMGSPILFRDERAGRDGVAFTLVKFRTMRAPRHAVEKGPDHDHLRVTRLGRALRSSSLDELPTLWNVVRGDMALVGPRPLPTRYVTRYSAHHAHRLDVRPGITGWAQVNGRNALGWNDRLDLDVWYVEHRSPRLDLRILARTVTTVLRREGISHDGHATMPEFEGPAQ